MAAPAFSGDRLFVEDEDEPTLRTTESPASADLPGLPAPLRWRPLPPVPPAAGPARRRRTANGPAHGHPSPAVSPDETVGTRAAPPSPATASSSRTSTDSPSGRGRSRPRPPAPAGVPCHRPIADGRAPRRPSPAASRYETVGSRAAPAVPGNSPSSRTRTNSPSARRSSRPPGPAEPLRRALPVTDPSPTAPHPGAHRRRPATARRSGPGPHPSCPATTSFRRGRGRTHPPDEGVAGLPALPIRPGSALAVGPARRPRIASGPRGRPTPAAGRSGLGPRPPSPATASSSRTRTNSPSG